MAIMIAMIKTVMVDHLKTRVIVLSANPSSLETLLIIYKIIIEYIMMKTQLNVMTRTGFLAKKYANANVIMVRTTIKRMFSRFLTVSPPA